MLSRQQASWGHMYLCKMTQIYSSCSESHIPPTKDFLSDIPHIAVGGKTVFFSQSALGSVTRLITESPKASPRAHLNPKQQLQYKVIARNLFVILGNCVDFMHYTCLNVCWCVSVKMCAGMHMLHVICVGKHNGYGHSVLLCVFVSLNGCEESKAE